MSPPASLRAAANLASPAPRQLHPHAASTPAPRRVNYGVALPIVASYITYTRLQPRVAPTTSPACQSHVATASSHCHPRHRSLLLLPPNHADCRRRTSNGVTRPSRRRLCRPAVGTLRCGPPPYGAATTYDVPVPMYENPTYE